MESFDFLAWLVWLNKRGRQSPGPHDCGEARRGLGGEQERGTSPSLGLRCFSAPKAVFLFLRGGAGAGRGGTETGSGRDFCVGGLDFELCTYVFIAD